MRIEYLGDLILDHRIVGDVRNGVFIAVGYQWIPNNTSALFLAIDADKPLTIREIKAILDLASTPEEKFIYKSCDDHGRESLPRICAEFCINGVIKDPIGLFYKAGRLLRKAMEKAKNQPANRE